jgi:hypothetical protein
VTCTILFYRTPEWARRCKLAGMDKPPGMARSTAQYNTRAEAEMTALHVNMYQPQFPCTVIELKSAKS